MSRVDTSAHRSGDKCLSCSDPNPDVWWSVAYFVRNLSGEWVQDSLVFETLDQAQAQAELMRVKPEFYQGVRVCESPRGQVRDE